MVKQAPIKGRTAVKVNFVLSNDAVAGSVSVVGDFNGWDPSSTRCEPAATVPAARPSPYRPDAASPSAIWPRAAAGTTTTLPKPSSPTASAATTPSSTPNDTAATRRCGPSGL